MLSNWTCNWYVALDPLMGTAITGSPLTIVSALRNSVAMRPLPGVNATEERSRVLPPRRREPPRGRPGPWEPQPPPTQPPSPRMAMGEPMAGPTACCASPTHPDGEMIPVRATPPGGSCVVPGNRPLAAEIADLPLFNGTCFQSVTVVLPLFQSYYFATRSHPRGISARPTTHRSAAIRR